MMKRILMLGLLTILPLGLLAQSASPSMVSAIREEVDRNFTELKKQNLAPYYISVRVDEIKQNVIFSRFGNKFRSFSGNNIGVTATLYAGDKNKQELTTTGFGSVEVSLISDDLLAIKTAVWEAISEAYYGAQNREMQDKSRQAIQSAAPDKAPYFSSPEKAAQYHCPHIDPAKAIIPIKTLETRANKLSAEFLKNKDITNGEVFLMSGLTSKYFVDTEGAEIVQNRLEYQIATQGEVMADDGMTLPLYESYFAGEQSELPSDAQVLADIDKMSKNLSILKRAPLADPYSGVALLSPKATGVFFHEFFGHRIEAARMKSQNDAGTFKNKVGEAIFSPDISVIFDPTIKKHEGKTLNGSYIYDDEGVLGQRVEVVKDGILKGFLTSRKPIDGFPSSNGHGRGQFGAITETRQSNMIISSSKAKSDAELRAMLIEEIKAQGKEFGYYIDQVSGGYTSTMTFSPNVFNVSPLLIYKVWADGRADEVVRGVSLIGTPLSVFSQIMALGDRSEVFTGTCGAMSGAVPVTAIAPAMLIRTLETQRATRPELKPIVLDRPDLTSKK